MQISDDPRDYGLNGRLDLAVTGACPDGRPIQVFAGDTGYGNVPTMAVVVGGKVCIKRATGRNMRAYISELAGFGITVPEWVSAMRADDEVAP